MYLKLSVVLLIAVQGHGSMAQRCRYLEDSHDIICEAISSPSELEIQLKEPLKRAKFDTYMQFKHFDDMPCLPSPAIFKRKGIFSLELEDFSLRSWNCPNFKGEKSGFSYVKNLKLSHMRGLEHWNWSDANEYTGKSVGRLALSDSEWLQLTPRMTSFYGHNVKIIIIWKIEDLQLDDKSLECLNCHMIRILYSNISNVRKEVFGSGLGKLQHLSFYGCNIASLPKDLFHNINYTGRDDQTFELLLQLNPLEALHEETFQPLKKSYHKIKIVFDNGKGTLKCNCDLRWLSDPKFDIDSFKCSHGQGSDINLKDFLQSKQCSH